MHSFTEYFGIGTAYLGMALVSLAFLIFTVGLSRALLRRIMRKQTRLMATVVFALLFFIMGIVFILAASLTGVVVS